MGHWYCTHCGKDLDNKQYRGMCADCNYLTKRVSVLCTYCGKIINKRIFHFTHKDIFGKRLIHNKYSGKHFCNKLCQGKWLGKNHGFGKHPENILTNMRAK